MGAQRPFRAGLAATQLATAVGPPAGRACDDARRDSASTALVANGRWVHVRISKRAHIHLTQHESTPWTGRRRGVRIHPGQRSRSIPRPSARDNDSFRREESHASATNLAVQLVEALSRPHIVPSAHSGHRDRSFRSIVITLIGHRDRSEATLALVTSRSCSPSSLRVPLARFGARCSARGRRRRRPASGLRDSRATSRWGAGW